MLSSRTQVGDSARFLRHARWRFRDDERVGPWVRRTEAGGRSKSAQCWSRTSMRRATAASPADAAGVGVFAEVRGIGVLRHLAQRHLLPATGDEQRDTRTAGRARGGKGGASTAKASRHRRGAIASPQRWRRRTIARLSAPGAPGAPPRDDPSGELVREVADPEANDQAPSADRVDVQRGSCQDDRIQVVDAGYQ